MSAVLFVYVTAPSRPVAEELARTAVTERLAACANVFPGVRSFYRWEGEVQTSDEVVLILKTRAERFDALATRIRTLHPATCPCIVAGSLSHGTPDFLAWVVHATEDA